ncbi:MAG: alpha/beta hydrolase [Dethiosulfatibacter sp.]|nr:alpha/beta hydrolase [Dethiosulfatibacter sp.]
MSLYESCLKLWPVPYEIKNIVTEFGSTQIIISGETDKPPLVLLHGASATSLMWVTNVETLSKKFRIYAIDTLGDIGRSKPIKPFKNKRDAANWLVQVLDLLEIDKAYYAGMSYGSFLGLNLAVLNPERVLKLIMISPTETFISLNITFWIRFIKLMLFPTKRARLEFLKWSNGNKEIVENDFTEMIFIGMRYGKYYISPMMKTIFSASELQKLNIEIMVLIGEDEVLVNVGKLVKRAKQIVKSIEFNIIPKTSHTLTNQEPETVNDYIIEFLERKLK